MIVYLKLLSKLYTGTTNGLRRCTQFGVRASEGRIRDSVRWDAWRCGSGEVVRAT